MQFHRFPFDVQICELDMFDFNLASADQLKLKTKSANIGSLVLPFTPAVREYDYTILKAKRHQFTMDSFKIPY